MNDCWIELSFPVPAGAVDQVADLLYGIGCIGVNVEERQLDTFVVPAPDDDLPETFLVKAYFESDRQTGVLLGEIEQALLPVLADFSAASIEAKNVYQEDWADGWKQHFPVLSFGPRLVVKPTWEEQHFPEPAAVVVLDPGMAFGTGSHETTRLCLQALADRFEEQPLPARVLDVGTGSGILAIAAAALGASEVLGCEIDANACQVARQNVAMNMVADIVAITDRALETIPGRYDLVIANIMAEENVRLATQLVERLAERGMLILSGILREKMPFVLDGFDSYGLGEAEVRYENEWCCIIYRRGGADG